IWRVRRSWKRCLASWRLLDQVALGMRMEERPELGNGSRERRDSAWKIGITYGSGYLLGTCLLLQRPVAGISNLFLRHDLLRIQPELLRQRSDNLLQRDARRTGWVPVEEVLPIVTGH